MSYNKFQSRKFILAITVILQALVLLWMDKINTDAWSTVNLAVVSGYLVANVWQNTSKEADNG